MLQVKTYLGKSNLEGVGVFADVFIPKGTVIWKYNPYFTYKISAKKISKFTESEKARLKFLPYYWVDKRGNYMIPLDHDRYMNHSREANTESVDDNNDIANRDIQIGEEITVDYRLIRPKEMWDSFF